MNGLSLPPGVPLVAMGLVSAWNHHVPIGTEVVLVDDDGKRVETKTRSKAWLLADQACVVVEARSGHYPTSRLVPVVRRMAA